MKNFEYVNSLLRSKKNSEQDLIECIKHNSCLIIDDVFSDEELKDLLELFDRDYENYYYCWRPVPAQFQTVNFDVLVTSPELDLYVRHPSILKIVKTLLSPSICVSDIFLCYLKSGSFFCQQNWHRDCEHGTNHPLRLKYLQAIIYLSDVNNKTPCFSISPESVTAPLPDKEDIGIPVPPPQSFINVHGHAGTVIFFNPAVLHTATVYPSNEDRKTIHIYYGMGDMPYSLWNDSIIPP
ncbi:MAG: phytanoyl-CoA dioxygenase family protein, partial [Acidobacteria bacterium]|nr:phytanoyl-CoA dioxygenase family protein [Acidobacteriota bacterium]